MQLAVLWVVAFWFNRTNMKHTKTTEVEYRRNKSKDLEEYQRLRKSGLSLRAIGDIFNVSRQWVSLVLLPPKKQLIYTYVCEECGRTKDKKEKGTLQCPLCSNRVRRNHSFPVAQIFAGKPKWKSTGRERVREIVRYRDNYSCQDCGKVWIKGTRSFDVHHLNGMCGKKSTGYDRMSEIDGLITLCHKCHFNRPDHTLKVIHS